MKRFNIFIPFLIIILFFIQEFTWACTTFNIQGKGYNLMGHNYDWPLSNGMLIVNKRGIAKVAMYASKYNDRFVDKNMMKQGQYKKYCPMSSSPVSALRLLPSRALTSELVKIEYQNVEKMQYYAMLWTDKIVRF